MGTSNSPINCFLTDRETTHQTTRRDSIDYSIEIDGEKLFLAFHWDHQNSLYVNQNKHVIHGLLINGKFPKKYLSFESEILDNEILENIIRESIYPKEPEDKLNSLLQYLHSLQSFEGDSIDFQEDRENLALKLYFKNYQEMAFYLFTLKNNGLIDGLNTTTRNGASMAGIKLTYKGLNKVVEINESGNQSNRCFIAMSFSESQKETRDRIKTLIRELGFEPILIDEQHFDSEVTINDAIIAEIKKCKFLVADFTQQKHGVYFEAGFALGLKKPVIYMCSSIDFENTHFDTNHYPHIIYNDLEELVSKLRDKIEAWIK